MPRSPVDTSLVPEQRVQRRLADLDDQTYKNRVPQPIGTPGPEGPAGAAGSQIRSGEGVPSNALGINGDYYLRTTTDDLYYKSSGTYSILVNLKGEKGETGAAGTNGAEGPAGSIENTDWKNSVRAATTANITIATALNPGDSLDGLTLAENDRVLVKNQTTKKENGIWVVKASPSRATDADGANELSAGTTVYVEAGTRNKRRVFTIPTTGAITPGTTEHEWVQLEARDFGVVESLPTSEAVKGDRAVFKAGIGVYWELVYTEEETYPWAVIGGPALSEQVSEITMNSETPSTSGPKVTIPLAMEAIIKIGSNRAIPPSGAFSANKIYIAGVGSSEIVAGATNQDTLFGRSPKTTIAKSAEVQNRVYRIAGASNITFIGVYVEVYPLRVG